MVISFLVQVEIVYKYIDKDGNIVFIDEFIKGVEKMDVKLVVMVLAILVFKNILEESQEKIVFEYKDIKIIFFQFDENFINNGGKVMVLVLLDFSLCVGDIIQFYFNGILKSELVRLIYFLFDNLE